MAGYKLELPTEVMENFNNVIKNKDEMLSNMTKAGAEVVYKEVKNNLKKSFKNTTSLEKGLKITKSYKTKKDSAVNTKVGFYGYNDRGIPIPLIAMAREYGTSKGEAKKPFFRKSFRKENEITNAMLNVQKGYIKNE